MIKSGSSEVEFISLWRISLICSKHMCEDLIESREIKSFIIKCKLDCSVGEWSLRFVFKVNIQRLSGNAFDVFQKILAWRHTKVGSRVEIPRRENTLMPPQVL